MFLLIKYYFLNVGSYVSLLVFISYLWAKYSYGYWKKRGIYSPPAQFPFGHLGPVAFFETQFGIHMTNIYNNTKRHKCVGLFMIHKKCILVNDLDLIKNVLAKDFNYFQGHGFKADKNVDPLTYNLFNLEGEEWRRIRNKLTSTFTSSKMKYMFEMMSKCADDMLEHVENDVESRKSIEFKEVFAKFSTDVIGSCAFGIDTNSFKYPDAEFRRMGRKVFSTGIIQSIVRMMAFMSPALVVLLKLRLNYADVSKFFTTIVPETIKYREENNEIRNDFLQLLIDMKNNDNESGVNLSIEEITGQVFVFFLAGFETSSTTASYALLELAKNPDIQDKLYADIVARVEKNGGEISYEAVSKMTYLSQVVDETLRAYPIVPFLFRYCTADYTIPDTKSVIEKGTLVIIPVLGIHRDEDIYPDPNKFDPDRFTAENISKRHQYTHIPFGEGPRICIGSRFGKLQVKLALLKIILHFKVSLCDETRLPIVYEPKSIVLHCQGGFYFCLTPRS